MKRIRVRLIIAMFTFVIGILATWIIYQRYMIPLTVCDLIRNPDSYTSKTIRVRAVLFGHDEMGLYASNCQGSRSYIHAIFDRESWEKFRAKANGTHYSMGNRDEYLVNVTLRGRFERYTDVDCDENGRQLGLPRFSYTVYCYNFFVSDIEQVEETDVGFPE